MLQCAVIFKSCFNITSLASNIVATEGLFTVCCVASHYVFTVFSVLKNVIVVNSSKKTCVCVCQCNTCMSWGVFFVCFFKIAHAIMTLDLLLSLIRYLYVNSRAWPAGCVISDPMSPPPIAEEIDLHVIDLKSLREERRSLRAHRAFTPNDECFFIFLDVSRDFVARCVTKDRLFFQE